MEKELSRWKKTKYTEEKIVAAVKQMEGGRATKEVARELRVSDQTLYNWKAKYGGMEVKSGANARRAWLAYEKVGKEIMNGR